MKKLLIVDDNMKYAKILDKYFQGLGYQVELALTGEEGLKCVLEKGVEYFQVIVADITMESQLAGLFMLSRMRRRGYRGTVVLASTGFDVPGVISFSRLFLRGFGINYLVPKTTILKEELIYYPFSLFSPATKNFVEVIRDA